VPRYLDTTGNGNLAIAICQRCQRKFAYGDLKKDPNNGLRVCVDCLDIFDPWRLPPRRTEKIALRYPRPDVPLDASEIAFVVLEDGSFWITDLEEFVVVDDEQIAV
jgi:hypothetical protein